MKTCVLGATGAIGIPITRFFEKKGTVLKLNSKNCDLNSVQCINDFSFSDCDVFVNASGIFGGLKSYETEELEVANIYNSNLSALIDQLQPCTIINISSASVSNEKNHDKKSIYYKYVKIKYEIEKLISQKNIPSIINLRCTNIISKYENFMRSGHSISSIYREYIEENDPIEVWSNEQDWREYLDADDLASLIPKILKLEGHHTLTIGSGQKTHMSEVIKYFNNHMNYRGKIVFTQLHKAGPQSDLALIPPMLLEGGMVQITRMEESIKKCVNQWNSINFKDH
ncbi:NAD-dependent epimerase/dehydratase family protein [Yersinia frederiksenii]|uniref:NAD-dependent epimerase/dehydratase family protein n=1 Tax=Yersinia frederiksenii TaxID=29484 RepID=UPI0005DAAE40|nr:NAD-dependent epimerase/dehydratase family protein [Yersinia frederiksenii]CFR05119.1 NAD dependent epimerase/dehydratase family [Yersinia frederiksenii]